MTDSEIIQIINDSMVEEFELDSDLMKPESHLIEDLEMDSLDFVDLVVVLQNAFGVKLRDDPETRSIRTLGDLHDLVLKKKREMDS